MCFCYSRNRADCETLLPRINYSVVFLFDHVTVNIDKTCIFVLEKCTSSCSDKQGREELCCVVKKSWNWKRREERPEKKTFHAVSTPLCLIYYHDNDTPCFETVEFKGGRNFNGFSDMEIQYSVQSKAGSCFCTFHEKGFEVDQIENS